MKKILITCSLVFVTMLSFSQEVQLKTLKSCLDTYKIDKFQINMALWANDLGQEGVKTIKLWDASSDVIQSLIDGGFPSSLSQHYGAELKQFYSSAFKDLLDYNSKEPAFYVRDEKDTCIFLGAYWYDKVFNTLRLDEKEMSVKVINELIMPLVYKAYSSFKNTPLKSVLIMGVYSSKSFADDGEHPEASFIACQVDFADVRKVVDDYELSEEELLSKMSVLMAGKDTDLRKVSLFK